MNGHCWPYNVNLIYHHNFAQWCHRRKQGEGHASDPSFLTTAWDLYLPQNNKFRLKGSARRALWRWGVLLFQEASTCSIISWEPHSTLFFAVDWPIVQAGKTKPQRGHFTSPRRLSSWTIEWGFKTELNTKGGSKRAIFIVKGIILTHWAPVQQRRGCGKALLGGHWSHC